MEQVDSFTAAAKQLDKFSSAEAICKFDSQSMQEYIKLYDEFVSTNSNKTISQREKGKSLEKLASFLLSHTRIFEVYKNIRSGTNEFDQLVRCNTYGKALLDRNIFDKRFFHFIGECKNLRTRVGVTYVGKICSLLLTTQNKVCILFSYNGVTGKGWNEASGLIKKIYMTKENDDDRMIIIDFNKDDFERIKNGEYLIDILENKIYALKNDVNYSNLISAHSLQDEILQIQE